MKQFIVFDLDGTLSDHRNRLHHVLGTEKDYRAYYDKCDEDLPLYPTITIFRSLVAAEHHVEIWTGRTDRVRDKTLKWLYDADIAHAHLTRMRREGDFTPDYILKGQWLNEEPIRPDMVFEDRPRMVKWWREQGIHCFDVGGEQ